MGGNASMLLSNAFDTDVDIDFGGLRDEIFPEAIFGTNWLTNSVFSGFVVVVLLLLAALVLRLTVIRRWKTTPTGPQMFLEWLVSFFDKSADEMTEEYGGLMGPYTLGAAAYICFGVLIELVGLHPAIADLSAGIALAGCTFLFIHTLGFAKNKGRRLKHYCNPINILTDAAVPISMTFRLFGSILSGMVIMELVYICVQEIWFIGLPMILPALLSPLFTLFHAFIQSYVFASLSLTFVQEAIEPIPKKQRRKKKNKAGAGSTAE